MDIVFPFSLQSSTDGSYVGAKTYPEDISVVIAVYTPDGVIPDNNATISIVERFDAVTTFTGDYNFFATLSVSFTEYDYIRIEISCAGCITKRFAVYPDSGTDTSSLTTKVDAIKAKTDNLPSSPAATSDIPTVDQIWGRQSGDTTSRTLTTAPIDISGLATSEELADAVADITAAIPATADIAEAVLTTDTGALTLGSELNNKYTVTHLIMASQNSIVESNNNQHLWKIRQGNTIIATRELTLNENGAITQTR